MAMPGFGPIGSGPISGGPPAAASGSPAFTASPLAGHTAGARTINVQYTGGAVCPASMPITITGGGPGSVGAWVQDTPGANGTGHFTYTQAGVSATDTVFLDGVTSTTQTYSNAAVAPDAPTGLVATNLGDGRTSIAGNAPADNGGASITRINVLGNDGFTNFGASFPIIVPNNGSGTITYTATATSSAGTGVDSSASSGVSVARMVAATFYIDPIAGNDNRPGHSALLPWATLTRFVNFKRFAGDDYVLTPGATYPAPNLTVTDSGGTSGAAITFSTGRITSATASTLDSLILPASNPAIISQSGVGNGLRWADPPPNLAIDNIKFVGPGVNLTSGATTSTGAGLSISSSQATNKIPGLRVNAMEATGFKDGFVVWVDNNTAHKGFDDWRFTEINTWGNRRVGTIAVINYNFDTNTGGFPGSTSRTQSTNGYIGRIETHDNTGGGSTDGGSGIDIRHATTVVVEDFVSYNIGIANPTLGVGGSAAFAAAQSDGVTFQFGEGHHCYAPQSPDPIDGVGGNIDLDAKNVTIQYCRMHHNDGGSALIYNNSSWTATGGGTGHKFRYNLCDNNRQKSSHVLHGLSIYSAGGDGKVAVDVYGNAIYEPNGKSINMVAVSGSGVPTVRGFNNIIVSKSGSDVVDFVPAALDGNIYWASGGTVNVAGVSTFAALKALGFEQNATLVDAFVNPLYLDPTNAPSGSTLPDDPISAVTNFDMNLPSSPAFAAGVDLLALYSIVSGGHDFHRRSDALHSIGADGGRRFNASWARNANQFIGASA